MSWSNDKRDKFWIIEISDWVSVNKIYTKQRKPNIAILDNYRKAISNKEM